MRVFATHMRHAPASLASTIVIHDRGLPGEDSRSQVAELSGTTTVGVDTGYRGIVASGRRRLVTKPLRWAALRARQSNVTAAIARTRPDVMYSSQQRLDCAAATRAAAALRVPQVVHLHYNVGPWLGKQPLRRLVECDHVITVSDFIRNQVLELGVQPEMVTTVHNTMALTPIAGREERAAVREELGIPGQAVVVGQVCRMDLFKGTEDTLHSFGELGNRSRDVYLLFVGDGPLRATLEREARRLGLAERVRFTGNRTDVPRLLPAIDVFSHPSLNDPCPLAVMEASAAGLPVVAWASGGIPEIVEDGVTGLLAPTGDRTGLARAMGTLVSDADLRSRVGDAARARIEKCFAPDAGGRAFAEVIEKAVQTAGKRAGHDVPRATPLGVSGR